MAKFVVEMEFMKDTKGAVVYKEVALNGVPHPLSAAQNDKIIGTLYLRKSKLEGKQPDTITVEVTLPE